MYRLFFVLTLGFLFSSNLFGQNISSNNHLIKSKQLDSLFQFCFDNQMFNGTILISEKGKRIYQKSFGYKDVDRNHELTENSSFLLASISKQFTAAGIIYLHSKGKIDYDKTVISYLPNFSYPDITVRQLLNHTSGLPEYMDMLNAQKDKLIKRYEEKGEIVTNERISSLFSKRKPALDFEPGSDFYYSNTGYLYLALIIEKLSNKSFDQFLNETFFKPLHLKNTFVLDSDSNVDKANGFKINFISGETFENNPPPFFKVYGDGGIYSSTLDLEKWFYSLDSGKIIDKKYIEEAYTASEINNKRLPYGFGWFVKELPFNQHKAVTHSGIFAGFTNSVFRDLEGEVISIILSSNSHSINREINKAVVRILYGMPFQLPKIKAEAVLGKIIVQEGIEAAKSFYHNNESDKRYDFTQKEFNQLGYSLLRLELYDKAIDVFEWNIERFPDSANAFDSLGEAYLQKEDKANALVNYKKAYILDSSNINAKQIIDRLENQE